MEDSNIANFISLHQILYPNDKFYILNKSKNSTLIKYVINQDLNFQINYIDKNSNIQIEYKYNLNYLELKQTTDALNNYIIISHIDRLIKNKKILKINLDAISEYLFELVKIINEYYNYCTICGTELELKGLTKISCCANPDCVAQSYQTIMDNKIIDSHKQDPIVFEFLLDILIIGTQHSKGELAFKPLPIIPNISNLNDLKKLISEQYNKIEKNKLIKLIETSENDVELMEKINPQIYAILKNAVSNNYFSMSSRDNVDISSSISKKTTNSSLKFIHINYSAEIENKFPQKYFLFHGSNLTSWYPIVKNGLKVMSGTAMMANGAAYGNGIYFSDSFQMSLGYSQRTNSINSYGSNLAVGVFEILEEPDKWKKSHAIYVIDNEKILLLRTIVLLNRNSSAPKDITDYFLKELPKLKQTNKLNVGILKNKRLDGEHKKLAELSIVDSINIQDQWKWEVNLKKIKTLDIKLQILFSNYPINPPIIKLINSNIKINTLVDSDGKIIIDSLNPANWKITNNLSSIVSIIYKCLQESL